VSQTSEQFEATLEALGRARELAEQEYFDLLERMRARVETTRDAARVAAAAAERSVGEWQAPADIPIDLPGDAAAAPAAAQEPWPSGIRGHRGFIDRLARWLLRDYLAVLDARHEALAEASRQQARELGHLVSAVADAAGRLRNADKTLAAMVGERFDELAQAHTRRLEAVREAVNRTTEGLDLVADCAERLRLLADAKDAETLQRAAHGPLRKMEIMFQEFGRQQESLLAELVGRRQDLDDLLAQLAAAPEEGHRGNSGSD